MKVGVVGLGKVGLILAQTLRHVAGHDVLGYDLDPAGVRRRLENPMEETPTGELTLVPNVDDIATTAEVIFVVVQTPHPPGYDGSTPLGALPVADFLYDHLREAVTSISESAGDNRPIIVIVSTVTPGTIRREIAPFTDLPIVYSPLFISLGSVFQDLLNPPFVLLGTDGGVNLATLIPVETIYKSMRRNYCPTFVQDYETAELLKMAYNCYRSLQITYANVLGELAEKVGANIDQVTGAIYQTGPPMAHAGMVDGGACRPRDAIVMSWLADRWNITTNIFDYMATTREKHSDRLAFQIHRLADDHHYDVVILGISYKPGVAIDAGSPGTLLYCQVQGFDGDYATLFYDPVLYPKLWEHLPLDEPAVYVIATRHEEIKELEFPKNSIVVDPWGWLIEKQSAVTYVTPGRI